MSDTKPLAPVKAWGLTDGKRLARVAFRTDGVAKNKAHYVDTLQILTGRDSVLLEPREVLIADMRGVLPRWLYVDDMRVCMADDVKRSRLIESGGWTAADFEPGYWINREADNE